MITKPVCFVAGKSGGHIVPCLTLLQQKNDHHDKVQALFFSANTPLDYHILAHHDQVQTHVPLPLTAGQTNGLYTFFVTLLRFMYSFIISFYYLLVHQPSEIITTGGAVAVPVCYAGYVLGIPIILYCLDVVPGKAARAIAPIAKSLYVCFNKTKTFLKNAQCAAYPVRYHQSAHSTDKKSTLAHLGLDETKKTVVIFGGSQGSQFLNDIMHHLVHYPLFKHGNIQIIHQTGAGNALNECTQLYNNCSIKNYVFDYQTDLSSLYAVADLIICRAGAGTLFEALFFEKPCIIIPLIAPTTQHQRDNALAMASEHPALFTALEQDAIEQNPALLYEKIEAIVAN